MNVNDLIAALQALPGYLTVGTVDTLHGLQVIESAEIVDDSSGIRYVRLS